MIYFILGIIVGILLCLILILYRSVIVRQARQIESRTKQKGIILEPKDEELSNWVEGLPTE